MSTPRDLPGETEVNAYLDGELSAEARREVEAAAAADPALQLRMQRDRAIAEGLHAAYDPVLAEPIPPALSAALVPRPWPWWGRAAAAIAFLSVGAGAGWQGARLAAVPVAEVTRPVTAEAAAAHAVYLPEVRHPVEVDATQLGHLNTWLSKRLNHPLEAPDLRALGFHLVGGRLLPDAGRPAAQFMYENGDGERMTVYIRGESAAVAPTALLHVRQRGFEVFHWHDDGMAYAVTARIPMERLRALAEAVHAQLEAADRHG